MRYLIGRYHEIALKGRNQWRFVDQLKQNLRDIFGDFRLGAMRSVGPRIIVPLPDDLSDAIAAERAALIFGLSNFSLSYSTPRDLASITREAIARATGIRVRTFRVRTKREDKRFEMNSMEIDRAVGGDVQDALGFEVDLGHPELTIS
ncbi:MAG TPA: THUMP domain-containing protein, partial [Candidatus Acidoferrales bacterium]|nr:THUMP domain-containing protein [Candidatus Acidoferrales bacterium]